MGTIAMLTTVDNPHDPFDAYQAWFEWDNRHGYHSTSLLARVAVVSDELTGPDLQAAIEDAIDEIVEYNISGMHRKVTREGEIAPWPS
jgi:hypothetical protein